MFHGANSKNSFPVAGDVTPHVTPGYQPNGAVRFHYAEFMPIITVRFDRRNIIFRGMVSQWTGPISPGTTEFRRLSSVIACRRERTPEQPP